MSLGVLNNLSATYAENNLNNTNNSLSTVLQQLSSGSKINSGADDAAGLSLVDGLQANQQALMQSQTNAQEGAGLLQVADGALSQVTNLLNRAVTLATEASNGTLNSSQDTAANQEYQSILSEINNIGTTTTYNQEQVFGSNTSIYTGDSSAQGSSINDLNIRTLSSSNVGDTGGTMAYSNGQTAGNVFINLSNDGTEAQLTDSLGASSANTQLQVTYLTTGADGAPTTNTATIKVGANTQYANTVSGMIDAINGSGLGLTASLTSDIMAGGAAVATAMAANQGGGGLNDTGIMITGAGVGVGGTGTNGVGVVGTLSVGTAGDTLGGALSIVGSDGKTHAVNLGATGSTDTLQNLMATINAAGYGINATINGGDTTLTFNTANSAVSISGSNLTDTNPGSTGSTTDPVITNNDTDLGVGVPQTSFSVAEAGDTLGGTLVVTEQSGATTTINLGTGDTNSTVAELSALFTANPGWGISSYGFGTGFDVGSGVGDSGPVKVDFTGLTDTTPGVSSSTTPITLGNTPTPNAQFSSEVGKIAITPTSKYGDTLGGSLTIGAQTITINSSDDTLATLAQTINNGDYGVTAAYSQTNADIVFTSANSALAIGTGVTDTSAGDGGDIATTIPGTDSSPYYSIGIASSGGIKDWSTVVNTGSVEDPTLTYGGTANTGITSDLSGTNGIATISYTDQAGQSLSSTDLSNATTAQTALTELNAAITDVAAQDGYIGAQINTLNAVGQVLSTQSENVQAAQNSVQATDYASATSNMSKYEILSQTGISALAQANSIQQEVTKLLQ
ncbi:MAG: flagellin [Terracidiphilus sp.]|jgi:flagellin